MNPTPFLSILSNKRKTVTFFSFSFKNIWMVWEKPIPLHPLLRTNAVTKQLLSQKERQKKEFFEKITINREVVVQEAGFFSTLYYIGVMEKEVLGRTKPINFWRWYRMIFGGILNRDKTNFPSGKVIIKKLYNSWSSERSKSLLLFPSRDKNV